jgi:hypothetical protein
MSERVFDATAVRFELADRLDHPQYDWPRTLLRYDLRFDRDVRAANLELVETDTGRPHPFQLSDVETAGGTLAAATVNFFADLPTGAKRVFELRRVGGDAEQPRPEQPVTCSRTDDGIVLDGGDLRVRLPTGETAPDDPVPGPVAGLDRGSGWVGDTQIRSECPVESVDVTRQAAGPLFATYEVAYQFADGGRYVATVGCLSGTEFVEFDEQMTGLEGAATLEWRWTGFDPTHRQAPNYPEDDAAGDEPGVDRYDWQGVDEQNVTTPNGVAAGVDEDGELSFRLGPYEPWGASSVLTYATFWDERAGDALGVFVDDTAGWQDGEYAVWRSADTLLGRYVYRDGLLRWRWPLATGTRSTGVAHYDHGLDVEAMERLEAARQDDHGTEFDYPLDPLPLTHTGTLANDYGVLHLDRVTEWTLSLPEGATDPPSPFAGGAIDDAEELARQVFTHEIVSQFGWHVPRQNGSIRPPPTRIWYESWVDGYARLADDLSPERRRRVTATLLFLAYVHAGEELVPWQTMLGGHPNFFADVKAVPAFAAFLFPDHPDAEAWADSFEKATELNARYHTRPSVAAWNARGGRWTENLGGYIWVALKPTTFAAGLLREFYDGRNALARPAVAALGEFLVNALSAPVGEAAEESAGTRRAHHPHGAGGTLDSPPRTVWLLGQLLRRYRPLTAEHLMWAAGPDDFEFLGGNDPERMGDSETTATGVLYDHYREADITEGANRGTNPHLDSCKLTGYGVMLRAGVGTDGEASVLLQQLDEGPNYRWGVAGQGGCGVLHYAADGEFHTHVGENDVGDRRAQDTDFCTNVGVWKDGAFRSIGQSALDRPMYPLPTVRFGELRPKQTEDADAWPEYRGRSAMLVGGDYVVTYDAVREGVEHRFSWFTHADDDGPAVDIVRGGGERTELHTGETSGVWHDGEGDCLAVVSHRDDLTTVATDYGCRVDRRDGSDYVFRDGDGVEYAAADRLFDGRAGVVSTGDDRVTVALCKGTRAAASGLSLAVPGGDDAPVAAEVSWDGDRVTGAVTNRGERAATVRVAADQAPPDAALYLDGCRVESAEATADGGARAAVEVPPGDHRVALTDGLPTPDEPAIDRAETTASGARVHFETVPRATTYRAELSRDGGETWQTVDETDAPPADVSGVEPPAKVHVRVVATNERRESRPGAEHPVYVTGEPPDPPEGVTVTFTDDGPRIEWGRVLGVGRYTLYRRERGEEAWTQVHAGRDRSYVDGTAPSRSTVESGDAPVCEYAVTATDGVGEGERSRVVAADPESVLTWDPKPGERFRRRVSYTLPGLDPYTPDCPERYPD